MTNKRLPSFSYVPRGPKPEMDISDRLIECEEDLEPLVLDLIEKALKAGWRREEVALALCGVADNWMLGQICNDETDHNIAAAIQRISRRGPGPF